MDSYNSGYASLSSHRGETPMSYAWWWRLVSFISSFLILLGFVTLQPLFEDSPKLRLSVVALSIIAVAFFTAGFALSALLCFACRDAQYQLDVIFTPALFSTATGFLITFYDLAITTRYHWKAATTISTVLGIVASAIYLTLAILTHRRRSHRRPSNSLDQPGNRLRSLFGLDRKNSQASSSMNPIITVASDQAPIEIISGGNASQEEELTRQQMLSLLKQRENKRDKISDSSLQSTYQSTYNIELPPLPKTLSENRLSMPAHVKSYYSPLHPNAAPGSAPPAPPPPVGNLSRTRTPSESTIVNASGQPTYVGHSGTTDAAAADERNRSRSRENRRMALELGEERARSHSRDVRRREIEMGSTETKR